MTKRLIRDAIHGRKADDGTGERVPECGWIGHDHRLAFSGCVLAENIVPAISMLFPNRRDIHRLICGRAYSCPVCFVRQQHNVFAKNLHAGLRKRVRFRDRAVG